VNPFTIVVNAMRALWVGAPAGNAVWGAVVWVARDHRDLRAARGGALQAHGGALTAGGCGGVVWSRTWLTCCTAYVHKVSHVPCGCPSAATATERCLSWRCHSYSTFCTPGQIC
jgi:hypothetical protein